MLGEEHVSVVAGRNEDLFIGVMPEALFQKSILVVLVVLLPQRERLEQGVGGGGVSEETILASIKSAGLPVASFQRHVPAEHP
jgi:hypothetical protein